MMVKNWALLKAIIGSGSAGKTYIVKDFDSCLLNKSCCKGQSQYHLYSFAFKRRQLENSFLEPRMNFVVWVNLSCHSSFNWKCMLSLSQLLVNPTVKSA